MMGDACPKCGSGTMGGGEVSVCAAPSLETYRPGDPGYDALDAAAQHVDALRVANEHLVATANTAEQRAAWAMGQLKLVQANLDEYRARCDELGRCLDEAQGARQALSVALAAQGNHLGAVEGQLHESEEELHESEEEIISLREDLVEEREAHGETAELLKRLATAARSLLSGEPVLNDRQGFVGLRSILAEIEKEAG